MFYGKKMLWAVLAIVVLALMPACGGGGGSSSSSNGASITGLWSGTVISNNGQQTNVLAVASTDNELRMFSDDQNIQYAGTVSIKGNQGSGSLKGYIADGVFYNNQSTATFSVSFTVVEGDSISGTYSTQGDSGSFTLYYNTGAERQSSLLDIVGNWGYSYLTYWADATVSNNGQVQASFETGCIVSGRVSLPSYDWSIYKALVNVTSCGELNGSYTGLVLLQDSSDGSELLWFMLTNPNYSYMDQFRRLQ